MLAIRLPEEIETRLATLASKTGRTKTFYAKEAILEHLDDMEDKYLAISRIENSGKRWSLDDLTWNVEFDEAAAKELRKLDRQTQQEILRYFRERIAIDEDPRRFGKPLSRDLTGLWRYRMRNYRMICSIQDDKLVVLVLRIGHHKDVYE